MISASIIPDPDPYNSTDYIHQNLIRIMWSKYKT